MNAEKKCPSCGKALPPDAPLGLCPECLIKSGSPTVRVEAPDTGFVPPTVEEIAKLFPQFEILSFIGKGGMGAVYKGRQPALDRFIALKILPSAVAKDPGFTERFNREARALARLNHPNIVTVYDFGEVAQPSSQSPIGQTLPPLHYLLMEFVDGTNLREIERAGTLSPEQALAIVPQICDALQFAHNEGIVHRDIKPENLLLDKKGRLKITDFGIAKILGLSPDKTSLTGAKDVMGTPHYMAPEQIEKPQTVDHRADIYSLGVVFYEMLTGELPLGKFSPPSKKVQVDVRLDEVVLHTLEKEPERRYQQASQVKTAVENITTTPPAMGFAGAASSIPSVAPVPTGPETSDKIILPAFLLAFFFGLFGAHRFYVGKIWTGLLQMGALLCWIPTIVAIVHLREAGQPTLGLFLGFLVTGTCVWSVVDWILLLCKVFTDGQGRRITHWVHSNARLPQPEIKPPAGTPPTPPPTRGQNLGGSNTMIIAPGIALMAAGVLKLISALSALIFFAGPGEHWLNSILLHAGIFLPFHWNATISSGTLLFQLIPALVIIFGAVEMIRLRGYAWAVAAAIVAIVFCSLVGFPAGIWALIVLIRRDVQAVFANASAPPATAKWLWILAGTVGAVCFLMLAVNLFSHGPVASASAISNIAAPSAMSAQGTISATDPATNSDDQAIDVGDNPHFSSSFVAAPGGTLTMNVDRGDISIVGSNQNTVQIQVDREITHASDADAAKILKEEQVVIKQTGNDIFITAQQPPSLRSLSSSWRKLVASGGMQPNLNVHYQIAVPRRFDVQPQTSGGNVKVATLDGVVKIQSAGGNVDCEDIRGNVDGKTDGGNVKASGVHGTVTLKTAGGRLDCDNIDGPVDAHTDGGNIQASQCHGRLTLKTSGGTVSIEGFSGPDVQAGSDGGPISAEFVSAPKADSGLDTSGGSVTVRLPENAAITLDAHTDGGVIRTELPFQSEGQISSDTLKGTINGGGPRLKLNTSGGNIEIHKGSAAGQMPAVQAVPKAPNVSSNSPAPN